MTYHLFLTLFGPESTMLFQNLKKNLEKVIHMIVKYNNLTDIMAILPDIFNKIINKI